MVCFEYDMQMDGSVRRLPRGRLFLRLCHRVQFLLKLGLKKQQHQPPRRRAQHCRLLAQCVGTDPLVSRRALRSCKVHLRSDQCLSPKRHLRRLCGSRRHQWHHPQRRRHQRQRQRRYQRQHQCERCGRRQPGLAQRNSTGACGKLQCGQARIYLLPPLESCGRVW